MKTLIIKIFSYVVLILIIVYLVHRNTILFNRLSNSTATVEAYELENNDLKEKAIVMKRDINELIESKDSINQKILAIARENKIKDRKIKSLQFQLENISKKDTIFVRDTIFRDKDFILDTCLMDKWSKTDLHLKYPNEIAISSEFNNEKYVIVNTKRVPIKKRKWFLPRWFTKKHTIVEVTVVDQNPYVKTEKQRFVEIVK